MRNVRTAFTLIEILIVVVILAILAAIVVPQFVATPPAKPGQTAKAVGVEHPLSPDQRRNVELDLESLRLELKTVEAKNSDEVKRQVVEELKARISRIEKKLEAKPE
jgi:prepilin-type N-terminal cleavage/methylation domain-containing protein